MEKYRLNTLPLEVLHQISEYLSVKDLLSCSLTCNYIRTAFNCDEVWIRHVPKDAFRLETLNQNVRHDTWDESFTRLCKSRQNYIRINKLKQNWKKGNFVKYSALANNCVYSNDGIKKGSGDIVYKSRYVFLPQLVNSRCCGALEIWDTSKEPKRNSTFNVGYDIEAYHIVEDILVIVQSRRIGIFEIKISGKNIKFLPLKMLSVLPVNDLELWEDVQSIVYGTASNGWHHSFSGYYLLSSCPKQSLISLHNVKTRKTIGAHHTPWNSLRVTIVSVSGHTLFLKMTSKETDKPHYLVYFDMKLKRFGPHMTYDDSLVEFVVCGPRTLILIFLDASDSLEDIDIVCTMYSFDKQSEVMPENRLVGEGDAYLKTTRMLHEDMFAVSCKDTVYIIHVQTLETIHSYDSQYVSMRQFIDVYDMVIAEASTVTRETFLWDVYGQRSILDSLCNDSLSCLYMDSLRTKLVYVYFNRITVIHLW